MRRTGGRRAANGCSGVIAAGFLILATTAIIGWPYFLDAKGASTRGAIVEKREIVRTVYDEWFRQFSVVASYAIPGQPMEHHAICDVDQSTYDSLHRGSPVVVHYFRALLAQPFIPATHLSPCTFLGNFALRPYLVRNLAVSLGTLLVILLAWKMRVRFAPWLFVLWLALSFVLLVLPSAEPEPRQPVPATATVNYIVTIYEVGEGRDSYGIPLPHPFQIVQLKFSPPGMDTPVIAVDKIDEDSVSNLAAGQSVPIVYDAADPRIVRLQEGTRHFPMEALGVVILCCLGLVLLTAAWAFIRRLLVPLP